MVLRHGVHALIDPAVVLAADELDEVSRIQHTVISTLDVDRDLLLLAEKHEVGGIHRGDRETGSRQRRGIKAVQPGLEHIETPILPVVVDPLIAHHGLCDRNDRTQKDDCQQ